MRRAASILRDKRTQYIIIIWLLLLKAMDMITNLMSKFQGLDFIKILGFGFIPTPSNLIWDALTAFAGLWTIYRILRDVFGFSIILRTLTKKELLSLSILVIWFFSSTVTLIQFTTLVAAPSANPEIIASIYHTPKYSTRHVQIFGWYWIDWGSGYFDGDFRTIKDMFIDGVFLISDKYTFISHPEAFAEAINAANKYGLEVGIIVFHPYDADFQLAWGLPKNQSVFADFSANKTWIEEVYAPKLRNSVVTGSSMGVSWYVYDDMTFDEVFDLKNTQLFIDITNKITNNKTIMLSHYPPPKKDITNFLNLNIMHWDWYAAPENITNIKDGLMKRPANITSIGEFIWLYHRTGISFEELQGVYDALSNVDRIEIFTLRIGEQTWTNAISDSILENPSLIEHLTTLNLRIKHGEYLKGYVTLEDWEINNVTLDLSQSHFEDPISVYGMGDISEWGTKYAGASYFQIKRSPLGQKMIEMRFCGNGTGDIQGWFAYRVKLHHPIPVSENTTLLLLLKLMSSSIGTAWTYYKMDFSTKENATYSLSWKFQDIPMNNVYKKENGTYFLLGSTAEWSLYQLDINNVFYNSFSCKPAYITGVEYAVGSEQDNEVKSQFLLAKISTQPLEINDKRIEDIRTSIPLKKGNIIEIKNIYLKNLFITIRMPYMKKSTQIQWEPFIIYQNELYEWSLKKPSNTTELKIEVTFNINPQTGKILFMDKEITPQFQQQKTYTLKFDDFPTQVTLLIINKNDTLLLPITIFIPMAIFLIQILSKLIRLSLHK